MNLESNMKIKQKIIFVKKQLENNNFTVLDKNLSEGVVYKIPFQGKLKEDGYECSFLYLTKNSSIKEHIHTEDIELYRPIMGVLSVDA